MLTEVTTLLKNLDWTAVWLSVKVALCTSTTTLPTAMVLGYFLARKEFRGKSLVEGAINLPMVMPPVTTGYILLLVLGTKGVIGKYLFQYANIRISLTFYAAVISAAVVSFPLVLRSVKIAMEMIDPELEIASRTLGASRFHTFILVTLPLALPGILSGFVLAFARSLGEFGATITFAGNISGETRTLPLAIYSKMQVPGKEQDTICLVVISVLISFIAIIASGHFCKRSLKLKQVRP